MALGSFFTQRKGTNLVIFMLVPEIKEEYLEDFKSQEKTQIRKIVEEYRDYFIEKWHEYFKDT